jgi:hypothetical protein
MLKAVLQHKLNRRVIRLIGLVTTIERRIEQ